MKRILLFLIAFALCLGGCGKTAAAPPVSAPATGNGEPAMVSSAPAPAPGGLLETGSGLNEHYYNEVDYFGMPDELTDSSFVLGTAGMAFHGSQPVMGPVMIHYGDDTIIRSAILHGDSFEIYAAGPEALAQHLGDPAYVFDVVLEDPEAEELRAREIRISRWVND